MPDRYMTLPKAARELNFSVSHLRRLIHDGRIPATKLTEEGHWRILAADVRAFKEGRRPALTASRTRPGTPDPEARTRVSTLIPDQEEEIVDNPPAPAAPPGAENVDNPPRPERGPGADDVDKPLPWWKRLLTDDEEDEC